MVLSFGASRLAAVLLPAAACALRMDEQGSSSEGASTAVPVTLGSQDGQREFSPYIFNKLCSFQHANVFQNQQVINLLIPFGLQFAMMLRG